MSINYSTQITKFCRAGLRTSIGEGLPAATIQEPDLGRVFAVASYGS